MVVVVVVVVAVVVVVVVAVLPLVVVVVVVVVVVPNVLINAVSHLPKHLVLCRRHVRKIAGDHHVRAALDFVEHASALD